jgi:dsRNA-specific ribonuclease
VSELKVKTIDIEMNIQILLNDLKVRRKNSALRKKTEEKFERWIQDLEKILRIISDIKTTVIPQIKGDLQEDISDKNLVLLAMMQPSTRKIFSEIKKQFPGAIGLKISQENLDFLERGYQAAQSLAWAGDTAIKYAILFDIWREEITSEELHNKRKSFEGNEQLAKRFDTLKLFEFRIHLDPDDRKTKSINEIKGRLIEAIFGAIFIEKGIEGLTRAMHLVERES